MTDRIPSELRRFASSAGWNLIGTMAPGATAVAVIPLLLTRIGLQRFGLLTIIWSILGYGGLLDFGISRALTKFTAEAQAGSSDARPTELALVGIGALAGFGVVVAAATAALGPFFPTIFHLPPTLAGESTRAADVLALGMPVILVSGGMRGILEGMQRFDLSNRVRIPVGVLGYAAPLGAALVSPTLPAVVVGVVLARCAGLAGYSALLWRHRPSWAKPSDGTARPARWYLARLLGYGGWLSAANLIYQLAFSADRIVIGSLLPIADLAFFAAPAEIVTRALLVPTSVGAVLFPAFAARSKTPQGRGRGLVISASAAIYTLMLPICIVLAALARPVLNLWLGPAFGIRAAPVLRWLSVGLLLEAMAAAPRIAVESDRPKLVAVLCIAEVGPYLGLLYFCVTHYGLVGAAMAWTCLMAANCVGTYFLARAVGFALRPQSTWQLGAAMLGLAALTAIPAAARGASATGIAASGAALCWATVLATSPPLHALSRREA